RRHDPTGPGERRAARAGLPCAPPQRARRDGRKRRDLPAPPKRRRRRHDDRGSDRSRPRHSRRRSLEDLRAVFHDERPEPRHRSGSLDLLCNRHGARGTHRGREHRRRGQRVPDSSPSERHMMSGSTTDRSVFERAPAESQPSRGIRVLVAEDEENLSQILCTFLRSRGHQVVSVGDGRSALQSLRDEAYDVAIVDIVMPEVDGLEVLRQLRAEPEPPEVIVITGNGTVETAITTMKLGAYAYLAMPYR